MIVQSTVYSKITRRLVPFLMLLYMVAFLDRVNISFAALTMNRDLGISDSLYGFAAGVFFLGYCLFEVPANKMLARVGARRWIAALLIAWGIVSVLTAFVPNRGVYVVARFLLGVAEAGFYPGVIFYLTLWLPPAVRTRVMALFMLAIPVSSCIGSPISAHILLMDQTGGLRGWQWLFLLEGSPAVLLGIATWFVLADNPQSAAWLSEGEKLELASAILPSSSTHGRITAGVWAELLRDSATYFLFSTGLYGLSFFLPKVLVSTGISATATGWWAAVPYAAAAAAMLLVSRVRPQRWLKAMFVCGALGFAGTAIFHSSAPALVCFALAAAGVFAAMPLFWSAATARMDSRIAGTAIAVINSVGAIGAFCGPFGIGWLRDATHTYDTGLWAIAGCVLAGAITASAETGVDAHLSSARTLPDT